MELLNIEIKSTDLHSLIEATRMAYYKVDSTVKTRATGAIPGTDTSVGVYAGAGNLYINPNIGIYLHYGHTWKEYAVALYDFYEDRIKKDPHRWSAWKFFELCAHIFPWSVDRTNIALQGYEHGSGFPPYIRGDELTREAWNEFVEAASIPEKRRPPWFGVF